MKDRGKEGRDGFKQTVWTKKKTEMDLLVKQDKSTSAFLREIEERRDERAHKLL